MTFDLDSPLTRMPNETIKAHNALMDYFLMGPGRSFDKLHKKYIESTADERPTKHLRTIAKWSTEKQWQARIAQQNENDNAAILQKIEADKAKILSEFQERHMSEAEALALLADQGRGDMGAFANVRMQADLADHPNAGLVKNITQHYTQTTRGEGENTQAEIKARIALGLYDAQKALELILKHHGSFEKDNVRQNLNIDLAQLTDEQLQRIAAGESPASVIKDDKK